MYVGERNKEYAFVCLLAVKFSIHFLLHCRPSCGAFIFFLLAFLLRHNLFLGPGIYFFLKKWVFHFCCETGNIIENAVKLCLMCTAFLHLFSCFVESEEKNANLLKKNYIKSWRNTYVRILVCFLYEVFCFSLPFSTTLQYFYIFFVELFFLLCHNAFLFFLFFPKEKEFAHKLTCNTIYLP